MSSEILNNKNNNNNNNKKISSAANWELNQRMRLFPPSEQFSLQKCLYNHNSNLPADAWHTSLAVSAAEGNLMRAQTQQGRPAVNRLQAGGATVTHSNSRSSLSHRCLRLCVCVCVCNNPRWIWKKEVRLWPLTIKGIRFRAWILGLKGRGENTLIAAQSTRKTTYWTKLHLSTYSSNSLKMISLSTENEGLILYFFSFSMKFLKIYIYRFQFSEPTTSQVLVPPCESGKYNQARNYAFCQWL